MRKSILLFLLFTTQVLSLDSQTQGTKKLEQLKNLYYRVPGPLFISSDQFNEFVLAQPRPYTLIILFLSFNRKSSDYQDLLKSYEIVQNSFTPSPASHPYPIYFLVIEYLKDSETLFKSQNFTSHSVILVTNPETLKQEEGFFSYPEESHLKIEKFSEIPAEKILNFLNLSLKLQVEIKKTLSERLLLLFYTISFLGLLSFGIFKLRQVLLKPEVWLLISLVIYFTCMGGFVYDILRSPQLIGKNRENKLEMFTGQKKTQYLIEGFLMSFIMCLGGVCIIGFHLAREIENQLNMRVFVCLLACILFTCLSKLTQAYRAKASWYRPSFYPPPGYISGPLINDQYNSF